jgi:phosphohistidine swiveling domain-containing protein
MPLSAFTLSTVALSLQLAAEFPLTVGHLTTGPQSHVELTNHAGQPITAWALAITTHPEAGRTRKEVWTVDGYLSQVTHGLAGASTSLERLGTGETRETSMDPLPADATVNVAAVVLDDGTAIGDESVIKSIFDRRARERDALQAVASAFNDVLSAETGNGALASLRERLRALVMRDASIPCRAALDAVETYQQKAAGGSTPQDIDQALRRYAAFVAEEQRLATKHARRMP